MLMNKVKCCKCHGQLIINYHVIVHFFQRVLNFTVSWTINGLFSVFEERPESTGVDFTQGSGNTCYLANY